MLLLALNGYFMRLDYVNVGFWVWQWFHWAIFCCVDSSCCCWRSFCYNVWKEFTPKTRRRQRLLHYRRIIRIVQSYMSTNHHHQSSSANFYRRSSSTVRTLSIMQETTALTWRRVMVVLGGVARPKKRWTTHELSAMHLMISSVPGRGNSSEKTYRASNTLDTILSPRCCTPSSWVVLGWIVSAWATLALLLGSFLPLEALESGGLWIWSCSSLAA